MVNQNNQMHCQMSDDKNQSSFSSSLSSKRRTDQPFLLWRCNHLQVWSERRSALSGSNYIDGPLLSITSKCLLAPRARCIALGSQLTILWQDRGSSAIAGGSDMLPFWAWGAHRQEICYLFAPLHILLLIRASLKNCVPLPLICCYLFHQLFKCSTKCDICCTFE